MEWKERLVYTLIIILLLIFCKPSFKNPFVKKEVAKSDTIIVHDTLNMKIPVPVVEYKDKIIYKDKKEVKKERCYFGQRKYTTIGFKSLLSDSIRTKVYTYKTDKYKAVISGYKVNLEHLEFYPQTKIITQTLKPRKWGISAFVGYGLCGDKVGMLLGVGISYTFLTF